jgi:uncharacterized protein (DUF433 family)
MVQQHGYRVAAIHTAKGQSFAIISSASRTIMKFKRITVDPKVCTGKPCIRGLRFPVSRLLGLLAAGETQESILKAYPYLESADIAEALSYAAWLAEDASAAMTR